VVGMIGITVVCVGWVLALTTMAVTTVRSERKKRRTQAFLAIVARSHGDAQGIHKAAGLLPSELHRTVRELNELVSLGAIDAVSMNSALQYCRVGGGAGVVAHYKALEGKKYETATYDPISRQVVFRGKALGEEAFYE